MTPEAKILTSIIRELTRRKQAGEPIFWFKTHGSASQQAGLPDLIVCYRGRFVGLEVKSASGRLSKLQEHTLTKINDAGGAVAVVRNVEEVSQVFSRITLEDEIYY